MNETGSDPRPPAILSKAGLDEWSRTHHNELAHKSDQPISKGRDPRDYLLPCTDPMAMGRRNGCGVMLLGWISDPHLPIGRVKVAWLTIFFVPVLPLRAYVVSSAGPGLVRFLYEMDVWSFIRLYR